tara:strand:+ start:22511 stop:23161 length:651 start_codon:yes stop_codon:yes gene_type:complete
MAIKATEVNRDENGWWVHPDLPEWGEGVAEAEIAAWFKSNGITHFIDCFEHSASDELNDKWFDGGICDCSDWLPSCDAPDSFLLSIHDTDDGPIALFAVPIQTKLIAAKSGAQLIFDERTRQLEVEGYTSEHDDNYKKGTLVMAAITYATAATSSPSLRNQFRTCAEVNKPLRHWPWEMSYLKLGSDDCHSSRIRELTKAGALIAAEIDKLQREAN